MDGRYIFFGKCGINMVYLVRGKYIISIIMEDSRDMNGIRVGNHGIGHDKLFLMGYYLIPMGYQWDINGNGISTVRKPLI